MALTTTEANMVFADRTNAKQQVLGIPAGPAGEDPGILCLESVNTDATTYSKLYLWADSTGALRYHTAIPTDEDSDGSVLATSSSSSQTNRYLSNLLTTAVNASILPGTTDSITLGDADQYWLGVYTNVLYLYSTAYLTGSSGTMTLTGDFVAGANGTGVDFTFYGDTSDVYMWWDRNGTTNGALIFTGATATPCLQFTNTNVTYSMVLSSDAATLSATDHASASLTLGSTGTNGLDLTWQSATSGSLVSMNGGTSVVLFDDVTLRLQATTTAVLNITAAANNIHFNAGTDNDILNIGTTTGMDLLLHGHSAGYDVHWDHSANTLGLLDNAVFGFGNTAAAPDITMTWDGTDLLIDGAAANTAIKIGATNQQDLYIYAATATNYIHFNMDDTANAVLFAGVNATFNDSVILNFGTSKDLYCAYNGSTNLLEWKQTVANTGDMTYGVDGEGIDQTWYVATASSYIKLDQGNDRMLFYIAKLDIGNATVTYDFALSTNSLVLSCTDNAGAKLILGTTGTNGLDIDIVGAGANQTIAWDAANGTLTCGSACFVITTYSANGRGFTLPVKTDAGAPGTTGTPNGAIVFNTNDNKFYVKVTAGWVASAALA